MKPRKDGLFLRQVTLAGKRHSFYGKTRKEANEKAAEAKRQHEAGQSAWAEKQTVEQYLRSWLDGLGLEVRPTTLRVYRAMVNKHLVPAFGQVPLTRLDGRLIKAYYAKVKASGRKSGTIRFLHGVLHKALQDALGYGLVIKNAAEQVKWPQDVPRELQVFSEEQARLYLEALTDHRLYALFVLALTTGMRQGELRALRWQDVQLERKTLTVVHTVQDLKGGAVLSAPKTKTSRRPITLSQPALAALRERKVAYAQEKLAAGHYWQDTKLVFSDPMGAIMYRQPLEHLHKATIKTCGLPALRFHDLRHTAATILIARGVPIKTVSDMLGHASIRITLDVYAHVTPAMQQQAADMMGTIFG